MSETMHTVTPYMMFKDAARALEFYKEAFGAVELMRHLDEEGRIRHAEITIGDSRLMFANETPLFPDLRGVETFGGSPVQMFVSVPDVDAVAERAVRAGATLKGPIEDKPYGRSGGLVDPFGLTWWICTPPAST